MWTNDIRREVKVHLKYENMVELQRRVVETPSDLVENVRSLMVELQSCRDDNERLIKEQDKQTKINAVLLQSLSNIQRQL
jgi:hypothetical protein